VAAKKRESPLKRQAETKREGEDLPPPLEKPTRRMSWGQLKLRFSNRPYDEAKDS
jgi:hypothetical protein